MNGQHEELPKLVPLDLDQHPELAAQLEAKLERFKRRTADTIRLEVRLRDFEQAIEERLKPALRKAIAEVVDEFLGEIVETSEGGAE